MERSTLDAYFSLEADTLTKAQLDAYKEVTKYRNLACNYDRINPTGATFTAFSKLNPYIESYRKALTKLSQVYATKTYHSTQLH